MGKNDFAEALWKMVDDFPIVDLTALAIETNISIDRLEAWMRVITYFLDTYSRAEAQQKILELRDERQLDGIVRVLDLAQQGYFDLMDHPGQEVNSVKTILFRASVDTFRHERTQADALAISINTEKSLEEHLEEQVATTSDYAITNELAVQALGRYYLHLNANHADEFYLMRFVGLSLKEVAESITLSAAGKSLGTSAGAVSRRVETLRKRFVHVLEKNLSAFVDYCSAAGYTEPVVEYVAEMIGDS